MELNEKTVGEIASQLGLSGAKGVDRQTLRKLESKTDAELAADILKLKNQLAANNISVEQQKMLLSRLMPMMDEKQKMRLQKIIGLLK